MSQAIGIQPHTDTRCPGIAAARRAALAVLKPSRKDLQHGLALHRETTVVDAFGFAPGPMTAAIVRRINAAAAADAAPAQIARLLTQLRSPAHDPACRRQYLAAW